jgi:hypothetical protein
MLEDKRSHDEYGGIEYGGLPAIPPTPWHTSSRPVYPVLNVAAHSGFPNLAPPREASNT